MKTTSKKQNTEFDSYQQCAASTGVPVAVLRRAKRAGCPAFRFSKIYILEFVRWYFENRDKAEVIDLEQEKARIAQATRKKLERENRIADGKLVDGAALEQRMKDELLAPLKQKLFESARKNGWEKHLVKVLEEIGKEFDLKGLL